MGKREKTRAMEIQIAKTKFKTFKKNFFKISLTERERGKISSFSLFLKKKEEEKLLCFFLLKFVFFLSLFAQLRLILETGLVIFSSI